MLPGSLTREGVAIREEHKRAVRSHPQSVRRPNGQPEMAPQGRPAGLRTSLLDGKMQSCLFVSKVKSLCPRPRSPPGTAKMVRPWCLAGFFVRCVRAGHFLLLLGLPVPYFLLRQFGDIAWSTVCFKRQICQTSFPHLSKLSGPPGQ